MDRWVPPSSSTAWKNELCLCWKILKSLVCDLKLPVSSIGKSEEESRNRGTVVGSFWEVWEESLGMNVCWNRAMTETTVSLEKDLPELKLSLEDWLLRYRVKWTCAGSHGCSATNRCGNSEGQTCSWLKCRRMSASLHMQTKTTSWGWEKTRPYFAKEQGEMEVLVLQVQWSYICSSSVHSSWAACGVHWPKLYLLEGATHLPLSKFHCSFSRFTIFILFTFSSSGQLSLKIINTHWATFIAKPLCLHR